MKKLIIYLALILILSSMTYARTCTDTDEDKSLRYPTYNIYVKGTATGIKDINDFTIVTKTDYCAISESLASFGAKKVDECYGEGCSVYEFSCDTSVKEYLWGNGCPVGCKDGACLLPKEPSPVVERDIGNMRYRETVIKGSTFCEFLKSKDCIHYEAQYLTDIEKYIINPDFRIVIESYSESFTEGEFVNLLKSISKTYELKKDYKNNIYKIIRESSRDSYKGKLYTKYVDLYWYSNNKIIHINFNVREEPNKIGDIIRKDLVDAYLEKNPSDLKFEQSFFGKIWGWFRGLF